MRIYLFYNIKDIIYFFLSFIIYAIRFVSIKLYFIDLVICKILYYILFIIILVLRYFVIVFHNYSKMVMGINLENEKKSIIELIKGRYKLILFVILTIVLSIIIGYPRLYIIWIFYFFKKGLVHYYEYYLEIKNWRNSKYPEKNLI